MKSFFPSVAVLATSLSLLGGSEAQFPNNTIDGLTCKVIGNPNFEDSFFSVVGVQGTGVHPRKELRELQKDPVTWTLFLQALAKFQAMPQDVKTSYFQISGIHGAPFGAWDGVQGSGQTGYCPHLSNMFGTWHRPYLALFEQILHDQAVEIANAYPEGDMKQQYQDAAKKLRLPYWDWAIDPPNSEEGSMPYSLRTSTVSIMTPNGTDATIPNPLYQYNFHPNDAGYFETLNAAGFKFSEWQSTIRFPVDGYASNATSRNDEVNNRVTAQQVNNRDMLYKLLTVWQPFNEWSNKANGGKIGNVETLHDGIHNSFGLGHMGIVDVSAFDPVFWFHHCNIDRIIAMYQTRYPDSYIEPAQQAKASYTMSKDSMQDGASPLAPFHMNAKGDMWNSYTSRKWESFGYTYPELESKPSNESLTLSINRLYRPVTQGLMNSTVAKRWMEIKGKREYVDEQADGIDWMAEVNMPTDIQITYSVRVFLGQPGNDPKHWATDPNYIGQVASLASPRTDSDVIVTANVVLTDKLQDKFNKGEIKSLEKADVEAYLQENFYWRMQKVDLTEISRETPPKGLNVTVFSVPIHLPQTELEVPTWAGDFEYKAHIDGNPAPMSSPVPNAEEQTPTQGENQTEPEAEEEQQGYGPAGTATATEVAYATQVAPPQKF